MPIALTDQMRERFDHSVAEGLAALVGTASAAGVPDMAFKGSVMVWDDEHLAFWERAHGMTLANLRENPQACILYRNPTERLNWRFWGVAELLETGALRDQIMARTVQVELDRDPERKGVAVLIRVDKVIEAGKVTMER
jgi:hypothetical protein